MDIIVYCEEVLMPFLDMLVDLYDRNEINYRNALRLGGSMCELDYCLLNKHDYKWLDEIYENFKERLNKVRNYGKRN